ISEGVIHRWRKMLGVPRTNNEGSRRLIRAASERGAEQLRGRPLTDEQVERRRRTAHQLNLGRHLHKGYHGPWWTKSEENLLGRLPDEEVARRTSRSTDAVRQKRETLARERHFRLGSVQALGYLGLSRGRIPLPIKPSKSGRA